MFQQVTGINTVIYYAPTLLHGAGLGNSAALLANVVNGAVNVGMTIVAIWLLDRVGRRPLLLGGTAGMAVGMIIVALHLPSAAATCTAAAAVIAIAGLLIYTGSFAIGLGPVFWLLISEIYPLKIRGQAMSVATMANWARELRGHDLLPDPARRHRRRRARSSCSAGLTIVALAYFWRQVPETKSRSLQEIERDLVPVSDCSREPGRACGRASGRVTRRTAGRPGGPACRDPPGSLRCGLVAAGGQPEQQAEDREGGRDQGRAGPAPVLVGLGAGRGADRAAREHRRDVDGGEPGAACGSRS